MVLWAIARGKRLIIEIASASLLNKSLTCEFPLLPPLDSTGLVVLCIHRSIRSYHLS
jgi:hypothetical protein